MKWGHKVSVSRNEQKEVTREEYNEAAGVETPEQPPIPECAVHVWGWWWELNARRPPGFDSVTPLSYAEISYWLALTGRLVAPEEVRWLIVMDDVYLQKVAEEQKSRREREEERSEIERKQQAARGKIK